MAGVVGQDVVLDVALVRAIGGVAGACGAVGACAVGAQQLGHQLRDGHELHDVVLQNCLGLFGRSQWDASCIHVTAC